MSRSLSETLRLEGGQVLATLIRMTGRFDLAEDALQDALLVANEKFSDDRLPDNPAAWLTTVAKRKALDRLRRESKRAAKEAEAMSMLTSDQDTQPTDQLRLLFTCCHPALSPEARVALSLRTLGGVTTKEIARAFLVSESTMGQRISRAKSKIASAHIPYRVPEDHELPDRLDAVLNVIYLIFTTGHHAPFGSWDDRVDLADEGIRLARMLAELMPDEPECLGLLALCLATAARQPARQSRDGSIVLLADQDRSLWNQRQIAEAAELVDVALRRRRAGPYQVQAAISTLHSIAKTSEQTDWPQIVSLYRMLEQLVDSPVITVNRAVAEAEVSGPQAGLELLDTVEGLDDWHFYWSARADFLRRLYRGEEARIAYKRALDCDMNETDRAFLTKRLAEVG
ncbi:MAG: RNA polymerase sigma factor [Acidimicrobiia bacterium]|nr:RNA polymerase sigma factor [Acidimicrobiia bacterium]